MPYFYDRQAKMLMFLEESTGNLKVMEECQFMAVPREESVPVNEAAPVENKKVKIDKVSGKKVRHCKKCGGAGHRADHCSMTGRQAAKVKRGALDVFDSGNRKEVCPIDEDTYILIKQKKNDDMTATEISEMLEIEKDIAAEAMISPDWDSYSGRFTE